MCGGTAVHAYAEMHLLLLWLQVDCLTAKTPFLDQIKELHGSVPMRHRLEIKVAAPIGPVAAAPLVCFSPPCGGAGPAPDPAPAAVPEPATAEIPAPAPAELGATPEANAAVKAMARASIVVVAVTAALLLI